MQKKTKFAFNFNRSYGNITYHIPHKLRDTIDGTQNTLLAVSGCAETTVTWTKPGGLYVNSGKPESVLGTIPNSGFAAAFFDGHIETIPANVPTDVMNDLINHQDGNAELAPNYVRSLDSRIRDDVVKRNASAMGTMLNLFSEFSTVLSSVQNRQAVRGATAKLEDLAKRLRTHYEIVRTLSRPTKSENAQIRRSVPQMSSAGKVRLQMTQNLQRLQGFRRADRKFNKAVLLVTAAISEYGKDAIRYKNALEELQKGTKR